MFEARYLYLSGAGMLLADCRRGRLIHRQEFPEDVAGHQAFAKAIVTGKGPIHLLLDLLEEDFRMEEITHMRGRLRQQLVERRLQQHYRITPYRHATTLERKVRGHDHMLLSAITNHERLKPWRDAMIAGRQPLASITSLPYLTEALCHALREPDLPQHYLVISRQSGGGLRQSFLRHGRLYFSRLTMPMGNDDAQALVEETGRVQQYLNNARMLPRDDRLHVLVLTTGDAGTLAEQAARDPQRVYRFLPIAELSQRLKLDIPADAGLELFLLLFLARHRLANIYATPEDLWYWHLHLIRRGVLGGSALLLAAAVVNAGVELAQIPEMTEETRRSEELASQYAAEAEALGAELRDGAVSGSQMRETVHILDSLRQLEASPDSMLRRVSGVLDHQPGIHLMGLAWSGGPDAGQTPPPLGLGETYNIRPSLLEEPGDDSGNSSSEAQAHEPGWHQAFDLAGEVRPFTGFAAATIRVEGLVAALAAVPGWSAELLKPPVDVRPEGRMDGDTAPTDDAQPLPGAFVVRVRIAGQPLPAPRLAEDDAP